MPGSMLGSAKCLPASSPQGPDSTLARSASRRNSPPSRPIDSGKFWRTSRHAAGDRSWPISAPCASTGATGAQGSAKAWSHSIRKRKRTPLSAHRLPNQHPRGIVVARLDLTCGWIVSCQVNVWCPPSREIRGTIVEEVRVRLQSKRCCATLRLAGSGARWHGLRRSDATDSAPI